MAGDTVANFNFQFTSNADALEKQWDGLIKKANELNKALGKANTVIGEGVKVRRQEVEVNHKRRTGRHTEIQQETRLNRLRDAGNQQLKTRIKGLAALAVAAVSANKVMGGLKSSYTGGVDTIRQAKALGVSPADLRNYENLTARSGGDKGTLHGNLQTILTKQGDIRTKGGDPIIALANSIGLSLRNKDGTDRDAIGIHKDIAKIVGSGNNQAVIASIMSMFGLDRSGVLMAGMNPAKLSAQERDVKDQHQITSKEAENMLKLSESIIELSQTVDSIFTKVISLIAPDASTAINEVSDVLQGKTGAAKSLGKRSFDSIVDGLINYTPQGWLVNQASQFPDFFSNINSEMKGAVNANRANNQNYGNTSNTTNNNSGGNSTTIHVGTADEAGKIASSVSTIDNTIGD